MLILSVCSVRCFGKGVELVAFGYTQVFSNSNAFSIIGTIQQSFALGNDRWPGFVDFYGGREAVTSL